jgi:hypothetical protein
MSFLGTAQRILCVYGADTGTVCDIQNKSSESELMFLFYGIEGTAKVIANYYVNYILCI